MECEALPVLLREDTGHCADRHRNLPRRAVEACRELDQVIADLEVARSVGTDIEDDLAVAHVFHRHARGAVHYDRDVRRQTVVHAPFPDGADQVRCGGGRLLHLRMTFSDGVNASMNAGLLKIRSAYFINGAACLGSW